jgi:recombination protein RecT
VLAEFGTNVAGDIKTTDYQRRLIQSYFIMIDRSLKIADDSRAKDNPLPCKWENVNLRDLALSVMHYSKMGLDPAQDNHLFPIPFRNKKTGKYDVNLMIGYNGKKYIAGKYAAEKPSSVTIELVYSNDTFKVIKKDVSNQIDSYEFNVINPFDRGAIIGGFGYIAYADANKNKLIIMSKAEIEKRKPAYASAEFWGGKKAVWDNGKKVGEKEIEGWYPEMCLKTLVREVYGSKHMPLDPQIIDDNYQYWKTKELEIAALEAQAEIDEFANKTVIDIDPVVIDDTPDDPQPPESKGTINQPLPDDVDDGLQGMINELADGPDF